MDEPVILVFWGDHYNPIDSNYDVYTSYRLCQRFQRRPAPAPDHAADVVELQPSKPVDLGTIAAYDISPVMMDLYGLEAAALLPAAEPPAAVWPSRTNTRGTTAMNLDGTTTQEPTEFSAAKAGAQKHWLLQYDLMFGKGYALQPHGPCGPERRSDTGK